MATIRKRGSKYQAIIRRSGLPRQSKAFPTKRLAQQWAREIENKIDRGLFLDQTFAKSTTFNFLIERFLKEVTAKKRKQKPIVVDTCIIRRIQREEPELCELTIDKLKPSHFEAYRDKRLNTPSPYKRREDGTLRSIAEGTVVRELSLLYSILQHRFTELGLPYNPASSQLVKRPVVRDKRDIRLSDKDKQRLIEACYNVRNNLIGPFVEMGFETGARRGEILSLLWRDVNLDIPSAMFRDVKNTRNPDNIRNRTIGLSTRAIIILQNLPRDEERVFPMSENAFKLSFKRTRKKLGMSHFHFHDTRHDFISRMVEAGWDAPLIMAQVGHSSMQSLIRYMTIKPQHLSDQLAKLDKVG